MSSVTSCPFQKEREMNLIETVSGWKSDVPGSEAVIQLEQFQIVIIVIVELH